MAKLVTYTAHIPPEARTPEEVAEKTVFVKDGFSFMGFVFGGFWLLAQRLWLPAILFLAALGAVMGLFWWFGLPRPAYGIVSTLMSLLVGIEGHEWQRRGLGQRGFRHADTVSGQSLAECERSFFARWLATQSATPAAPPTPTRAPVTETVIMPKPGIIGVFPGPASGSGGAR